MMELSIMFSSTFHLFSLKKAQDKGKQNNNNYKILMYENYFYYYYSTFWSYVYAF